MYDHIKVFEKGSANAKNFYIEADVCQIILSNIGYLEEIDEIDYNSDDLNELSDVEELMRQIDAYYESGELDAATDIVKKTVIDPEGIEYMSITVDEDEKEITLDEVNLKPKVCNDVSTLLGSVNPGDILYLRRVEGKGYRNYTPEFENKEDPISANYYDCTQSGSDDYGLLREGYYEYLCDTILADSFACGENEGIIEHHDIKP